MAALDTVFVSLRNLFKPLRDPQTDLDNDIFREQQQLVASQCLPMGVVNIVNGAIIAFAAASAAPLWKTLVWYTPILLFGLAQIHAHNRFQRRALPQRVSGRFLRKLEWTSIIMGGVWGSAIYFLTSGTSGALTNFLTMMQVGMAAGVTSLLTPLPRVVMRYSAMTLAPITIVHIIEPSQFSVAIASLNLMLLGALIASSMNSFTQLHRGVVGRHNVDEAKRNLLDAVSSLNDAFSLRDADGRIVLKNDRYTEWFGDDREDWDDDRDDHVQMVNSRWLMRSVRPTAMGGQVCIHTDVTRLKNRERELIAARAEAEAADAAKTRFLSTMSHELRTPLNIILGFSKLMSRDSNIVLTPETTEEYSSQIHASADHLLTLITDIIDYSKIGLEKYMLDRQPVNLPTLLQRAIQLAAKYQKSSSIKDVEVLVSPKLGEVVVDRMAFQRILVNLLTNAFKFQRDDPRVIVKAGLDPHGRPIISVRDFGVGMSEKTLERAFEAFYQAESEMDRTAEGTGLGLTLSQRLAKLHGGDLKLVSRLGAGTTAIVILPAEAHLPGAKEAEGARRLSA